MKTKRIFMTPDFDIIDAKINNDVIMTSIVNMGKGEERGYNNPD